MSLLLVPGLLGCSGSLSNQIFYEDAAFLGAMPTYEELALAYPGAEDRTGDEALYYGIAADSLDGFAQYTQLFTSVADTARLVAPTLRADDARVWGPGAWDVYPGTYLRLEVSRTTTHDLYVYEFQASEFPDGPWTGFVAGTTWYDEDGVESGTLSWDQSELDEAIEVGGSGTYDVDYVLGETTSVSMRADRLVFDGGESQSSEAWLDVAEDASGTYEFHFAFDTNPGEGRPRDELVEALTQWDAVGFGRVDALIDGGDTPYPGLVFTQCWSDNGALTFQGDSEGVLETEGDETSCTFQALEPNDR
ncbi:MAG: hypothetical protein GY913_13915 [Proteobacteria bacterium]|nr:hypothetical protein [Pseudomonadota bacterium]